jgi:4'-phosphopantetheinyl transferase
MIYVCYTRLYPELSANWYHEYFPVLPQKMQAQNSRYIRLHDRLANLMGKVLLMHCFEIFGLSRSSLNEVCYTGHNRPFLQGPFDFNITHSADYVMCAFSDNGKIGIDLELVQPVEFRDFDRVMTSSQWFEIIHAQDPLQKFYQYWTIKESVIKADGRGLSMALNEISFSDSIANASGRYWWLKELAVGNEYAAHLATEVKADHLVIEPWLGNS